MQTELERFENVVAMFFTRAAEGGDKPFLWAKKDGSWQSLSWAEVADKVARLAAALQAQVPQRRRKPRDLLGHLRPALRLPAPGLLGPEERLVPTFGRADEEHRDEILESLKLGLHRLSAPRYGKDC